MAISKRDAIKTALQKKPIRILLVCCMLIVAVSIYRYETRYNDRPFYDHKQCEARFDICGDKMFDYNQPDIEMVQTYMYENYGIAPNKIGAIGTFLRSQGLEYMRVYTYRVEVLPGYAFNFSMNDITTPYGLKTFGYEYVENLDETQGLIVGVLHEFLTGKDYPEIRAIFEHEDLFTIENDYFYDSSIRFMYESEQRVTASFYQPPKYDDVVASLIKEVVEMSGEQDTISKIINYVENTLNWSQKLTLLPYTSNREKFDWAREHWISARSRTIWSDEVAEEIEGIMEIDKISIEILFHRNQEEVKRWR